MIPCFCSWQISPQCTVTRNSRQLRVHKGTYAREGQQLGSGIRIPASRLEKIEAASKQTKLEIARSSKQAAANVASPSDDTPAPVDAPEVLRIGRVVAIACLDPATNKYTWECGRVQKMLRKSSGKKGRDVAFIEPILYLDAVASKVKVVCNWYKRDSKSKGYVFTYDGENDAKPYSLENALGLVNLALPRRDRYDLLDPSQGARLDAALQLTKPSERAGSKRTKGEEQLAEEGRRERQQYLPEDLGIRAPSGKARAAPTVRVRS